MNVSGIRLGDFFYYRHLFLHPTFTVTHSLTPRLRQQFVTHAMPQQEKKKKEKNNISDTKQHENVQIY